MADTGSSTPRIDLLRGLDAVLDGFVAWFGVWTLFCNVLVFGGGSFSLLLASSPLALAAAIGVWLWLRRSDGGDAAPDSFGARTPRIPLGFKLAGALVVTGIHAWTGNLLLFWSLGAVFAVACLLDQPRDVAPAEAKPRSRIDVGLLVLALAFAVTFTAIVHRPDADDAYYMSVPVAVLDHPDRPVLGQDTMHGEEGLPLLGPFYRTVSYELLIAAVSFVTGVDHRLPYYTVFPLLFAGLLVVAHWLPLRRFSAGNASLAVLFVCLVIVVWGDVHHTYGNFGFVRLFQGKGVLVSVCAPALVYYGMRYASRGDRFAWVRLALAQLTMMGFSASGVVVAPLLAGVVLLGNWRPDLRSTRAFLVGLLSSSFVSLAGILVLLQVREFGEIVSPLEDTSTARSLELVLGGACRTGLALLGLLGAVAVSRATTRHRGWAGYLTAGFLLLLNPWAGDLISRAEETFAWRSLWALPFPLILGTAFSGLASRGPSWRGVRLGMPGALAFASAFALCPGLSTFSADNKVQIRLSAFRVADGWPAAARAVEVTPPDGVILAPRRVAMWITGFRGHPRLLAVRQDYLDITVAKVHGAEEARIRRQMMNFVHGKAGPDMRMVLAEILRRKIDTVVTHPDLGGAKGAAFFEELERNGYVGEEVANGYRVWTRSQPAG